MFQRSTTIDKINVIYIGQNLRTSESSCTRVQLVAFSLFSYGQKFKPLYQREFLLLTLFDVDVWFLLFILWKQAIALATALIITYVGVTSSLLVFLSFFLYYYKFYWRSIIWCVCQKIESFLYVKNVTRPSAVNFEH